MLTRLLLKRFGYDLFVFSNLSRVLLCHPMDYSPPASLSIGFPRQEYWRGLPFPYAKSYKSPEDQLKIFQPDALSVCLLWRHVSGRVVRLLGRGDTYLLLDVLDLSPQPLDQPVKL